MKSKNLKKVIHETAQEFYEAGVMTEQTMREFDAMCLSPVKRFIPKKTYSKTNKST